MNSDVTLFFFRQQCSFGFAVHLFSSDLKSVSENSKDESDDGAMAEKFGRYCRTGQDELNRYLKAHLGVHPIFSSNA